MAGFFTSFFLALQAVSALPAPHPVEERGETIITRKQLKAVAPTAELQETDSVVTLSQVGRKSAGSKALHDVLASGMAPLNSVESGAGYAINTKLGSQTFPLIFDTGSSDLWVPASNFQCVGPKGADKPQSTCDFGPLFTQAFSEGKIANENFNISYGDGEFAIGVLGYEDVTIAGVTVDKQEIAKVTEAFFEGTGDVSGIVGFAYPSLTSAYSGTNPAADGTGNAEHYQNFIHSAINQGKIKSLFSHVIERGANGGSGTLALGGIPSGYADLTYATTPLEMIELTPHPIEKTKYSYYTITPGAYVLDGETAQAQSPVIVDSGTTLMYLPDNIVEAVAAAFDPPSVYIEEEGVFENYCDATAPNFSIRIGGTDFMINAADLLLQGALGEDPSTGGCVLGIQPGGSGPYILGDTFLKNVVAVYDIGAAEMKFAEHNY